MKNSNKAVFLDRDGVINKEVGDYIKRFEDFEILSHVRHGLKILTEAGFKLIIITNQGGIAKGMYTRHEMDKMHAYLAAELEPSGVVFTDVYFCPHHPQTSNCLCRKPESLLVEKAISKHDIDASQSYFIGDKERDIVCGEGAGVKGILIEPNEDWTPHVEKIISQLNAQA
ncbi:MAG: histidinol phosphate phosphatase [Bacteroidetes bacterium B1(2017)]|nr:MAG: histidinol phosphate phosphatase [Bacteroidetes bacterium B1(2017)]